MLTVAKSQCNNVTISCIPPRIKPANFAEKAEWLNAELKVIAEENGCECVNHSDAFYLPSGEINDGYFDNDLIHPNIRGTNKMAKALGLPCSNSTSYNVA